MQKKRAKTKTDGVSGVPQAGQMPVPSSTDLWVRPNMSLRHERQADGELSSLTSGRAQKFLELANIALGLKKPAPAVKKARSVLASASVRKQKRSLQQN